MNMKSSPQFYNYLAEGNIKCQSNSKTSREVIQELIELLARNNAGLNPDEILQEVIKREELMPTVAAPGLAVPHARLASIDKLLIAMATSKEGIIFDEKMPPVHVVVLLLTPLDDPGLHLQVFAALAKDFLKPGAITDVAGFSCGKDIIRYFNQSGLEIPKFLLTKDVMESHTQILRETDTLNEVIEKFATLEMDELPVVDEDGSLRGVVALADILKFSLPEHLLWMDDLSSVYQFQPFSEVLQTASDTKVADFMREDFIITVNNNVPAIQLAKLFLVHKVNKLFVLDENEKYTGWVELKRFAARLFWE